LIAQVRFRSFSVNRQTFSGHLEEYSRQLSAIGSLSRWIRPSKADLFRGLDLAVPATTLRWDDIRKKGPSVGTPDYPTDLPRPHRSKKSRGLG
jgi:hypothetical protein